MSFGSLPSVLGNGGGVAISVIGGTGLFADGTAAAPSISFASNSNLGFYKFATGIIGISQNGAFIGRIGAVSGGVYLAGNGGGACILNSSGACAIEASGTNQNITLTPSGTGNVVTTSNRNGALKYALTNADGGTSAYTATELSNGSDVGVLYQFGTAWTTSGRFIQASTLLDSSATGGMTLAVSGGTPLRFWSGAELARFAPTTGRFLLGTTTDSANGILQLAAHTDKTGGVGFGTDLSLYRRTTGCLALAPSSGAGDIFLEFYSSTTRAGYIQTNGTTDLIINSASTLRFYTGGSQALNFDSSQNATFISTGVSSAGLTVNLGDHVKARYATFGNVSNGAGRGAIISQLRVLNFDDTFFGRNLVAVPLTDSAKTLESLAYAGMLLRGDGSIDWVANATSTAGASITPTVRMSLSNAGLLTMTGALRLNNAYVAGAVVGTGYITIQDSTGTTYRVPVLV